jgi:hypothetical protein
MASPEHRFGAEPGAAELLGDPIAQALMAADKIDDLAVFAVLRAVGHRREA